MQISLHVSISLHTRTHKRSQILCLFKKHTQNHIQKTWCQHAIKNYNIFLYLFPFLIYANLLVDKNINMPKSKTMYTELIWWTLKENTLLNLACKWYVSFGKKWSETGWMMLWHRRKGHSLHATWNTRKTCLKWISIHSFLMHFEDDCFLLSCKTTACTILSTF